MNHLIKILLFIGAAVGFSLHYAHAASFDCGKAKSMVEKTICSDRELSAMDEALAKSYADTRLKFSDIGKSAIKDDQVIWIKSQRDCVNDKGADTKKIVTCLKYQYKSRIASLVSLGTSKNDVLVYPVNNKAGNVTYEQIDSQDLFSKAINAAAKKMAADANITEVQNSASVYIVSLTVNLYEVHLHIETNGGAHPSSANAYSYFNKSGNKKMVSTDIFDSAKIKQLGQFVLTQISKDAKECAGDLTSDELLKIVGQMRTLKISVSSLGVGLDLPHVCRAVDDTEIDWNKLMPFLTDSFKAEVIKLK